MPELPEVETMVRGIRSAVEHHVVTDVHLCRCRCKPILFEPQLTTVRQLAIGQQIRTVHRRAKRIVMTLTDGSAFVIEPRMTGLMLLTDPPDFDHLRVEWRLRSATASHSVWFWDRRGLGTVRFLAPDKLTLELGPDNLGPDALDLTPALLRKQLSKTNRAIKVALLDQKLIAGIGNLYASEILHRARIHPEAVASRIAPVRLKRLHAAIIDILTDAIHYEGSTLGDGTYRNALNQNGSYQNMHRIYAKQDQTCGTCGQSRIKRIVQAQRSTFFCPRCQRR